MKIAIGSDHRGFEAKERIKELLRELNSQVVDCGTDSREACDYSDAGLAVATHVAAGRAERGILLCGSGIGMSIVANKVRGIRAALCHDELTAEMSRRHNDANVLCLPADLIGERLVQNMVRVWIETEFEGGRHARRVEKIMKYDQQREDHPAAKTAGDPAEPKQRP